MSPTPVLILGAGPAASLLSMALQPLGISPVVIGRHRRRPAVEGLSQRVVDALVGFECRHALEMLGPRWHRVSRWAGSESAMNGEFVVERSQFDRSLMQDAIAHGVSFREGTVSRVKRASDGGFEVIWQDAFGNHHLTRAAMVVECRGQAAPKEAPDIHAPYALVAITRTFSNVPVHDRVTLTESFEHGWAWGGVDPTGMASVQVVVTQEMLAEHDNDLSAVHSRCVGALTLIPSYLGTACEPTGHLSARAIRPVLRGARFSHDQLHVGDACYTNDPLSGHGVFEAASGALAAAPAINTLIHHPRDADTAVAYLEERSRAIFASRMQAARDLYRLETTWRDAPFWRRMQAFELPAPAAAGRSAPTVTLEERGVVESGRIVKRPVLVSPEYPRGVRFSGQVDLGQLVSLKQRHPDISREALSRALSVSPDDVAMACAFVRTMQQPAAAGAESPRAHH
ncbi:flavin-dependent monooxygenase QhpG [Nitrogeniibacter aestuarii]|uniref:flavin-dependent monooxygenase QhpG n=1 Tax=Nitrogeniibacter aestuarii TaxID=2815343 RepID=UPI001D0F880D|nr:tryptophan 7-halogenase [Nitrogeniibacter aestuarii]